MNSITPVLGQLLGFGPDELAAIAAIGAAVSGIGAVATAEVTRRSARQTLRHAEEQRYNEARDRVVSFFGPAGVVVDDMLSAIDQNFYPDAIVDRARGIYSELLGAHFAFNQRAEPGDPLAADFAEVVGAYAEATNAFRACWQNMGRPVSESRTEFYDAAKSFAVIANGLTYGRHDPAVLGR